MKISCFRVKAHLVFHWCLYNKRFSYHFIKMWNSDQLPEQVNQPFGTQNDCATVLDNYPHVMIKIHHGGKLFLVINKALILSVGSELFYSQMINFFGQQGTDDLLEVKPPSI